MTGSLVRVADGDRRLTQYEIQVFLDNRGQPTYDLEPVAGKSLADLDEVLLDRFIARLRTHLDAPYRDWDKLRLLQVFRVLVEHQGALAPSLAGYLCFAVYPQEVFPSLHLSVVRYPTSHPGEVLVSGQRLLDNVKAEGSLVVILRQAMNAILRNLQKRAVVEGLFRRDMWEYPVEALREALVNALAHRDYSPLARATPVQVRIFPDRLELENPGGLFGAVTVERLGEPGLLATRNTHLMRLLEDLPDESGRVVCENRGTGITAMLEALRAAGMEPPRFDDRHTTFRLKLSNASLLDEATLAWLSRFAAQHLNDAQRLALAFLRREQRLTNADYRRLNPGLDSSEATRHLADLVRQKLLHQHGTRRWTYYTLEPSAQLDQEADSEPIELETKPIELETKPIELETKPIELEIGSAELPRYATASTVRRAILSLCHAAPLTSHELAQRLRRSQVYLRNTYLSPLVAEGLLERSGSTPTAPTIRYRTTALGQEWLASATRAG
jgi:ATP-dependent DNA helicase RecG